MAITELMLLDAAWLRLIGELGFSMHGHTMTAELQAAFNELIITRDEAGLEPLSALVGAAFAKAFPAA